MANLKKSKLIKFLISYKLTVFCLLWLMVLTFWGTLYQVENGLYITKERMFNSWIFMAGGFFPVPGARIILWLSLVNLTAVTVFRFRYTWKMSGMLLTHVGMLILIIGSGFTLHLAQESSLTLKENQGLNVSNDYHEWELALWSQTQKGNVLDKEVSAMGIKTLANEQELRFDKLGYELTIQNYFSHCDAFTKKDVSSADKIINASGINTLTAKHPQPDLSKNIPGIKLSIRTSSQPDNPQTVMLYGGERFPTSVFFGTKKVFLSLRRKRHVLPITVKLLDFKKVDYTGTQMAKSFESHVEITTPSMKRNVRISMNKPLRYGHYTFYQSSYSQSNGAETSTLSVVRNSGRLLPYIASLVISLGMLIHFCIVMIKFANRKRAQHV
ncbi:MAG: cytochrome c biogenesis protein ResB [Fibrobacteria bacterium]|nr:cytochrome c biogenesis protein ResB [Fibrobacteria bacterium]